MAYARWIFKASLVDEYGFALPPVVQAAYGSAYGKELHGITLFANGHVMQMLEGEHAALEAASRKLQDICKVFGMVPVLREAIGSPASHKVAVGVNRFMDQIAVHLPPEVEVFNLCSEEIRARTLPGAAQDLLLGFL
ncbi:hypothetical protein [Rhodoferax mekongensis]|uniref:Uncharacterized protein n=1 Tax=Rhodoferax mekongensis TaxID=3068341 RepID=A0ABZ0AX04_9BURK|nr:hypothetical protein [Rhodoferax sp. TBRC 17307]WNO04148.1 hypothetical protein RAN89_14735 [Rhodoferax sp. TBRC 17307]